MGILITFPTQNQVGDVDATRKLNICFACKVQAEIAFSLPMWLEAVRNFGFGVCYKQGSHSSWPKFPEMLENFLEKYIFLLFCTWLNGQKFPEIDTLFTKFPDFRKFPEKWHLWLFVGVVKVMQGHLRTSLKNVQKVDTRSSESFLGHSNNSLKLDHI